MNKIKRLGAGISTAFLLGLTGCAFDPATSTGAARSYDLDVLKAYMGDAQQPVMPVSYAPNVKEQEATVYEGFYGHWVAKIDLDEGMKQEAQKQTADSNADPEMQKAGEEFAKAMAGAFAEMMTMELDIAKDGSFKMTMMGMPMEGNWKQNGSVLSLVPEKFLGMSAEEFGKKQGSATPESEPLELKISADGKSMVARDPNGNDPQEIVFKRSV